MLWANKDEKRIAPTPKQQAECPGCGEPVLSKCGPIMTWHWAHKTNSCPWNTEPETEWHREWKQHFPDDWQEVKYGDNRADILTPARVVEIQNSPISADTVREREAVYGNMIWIVNGAKFNYNFNIHEHNGPDRDGDYRFNWSHPRKSWWAAEADLYIDLKDMGRFNDYGGVMGADWGSDLLFRVAHIKPRCPCSGWGQFVKKSDLINLLLADEIAPIPIPKVKDFGKGLRDFTCVDCGETKTWRKTFVRKKRHVVRCNKCAALASIRCEVCGTGADLVNLSGNVLPICEDCYIVDRSQIHELTQPDLLGLRRLDPNGGWDL